MKAHVDPAVMRVARTAARDAMSRGAIAVVLSGSHARGDANAHSDIDLVVVLRRPPPDHRWHAPYLLRGGYLVSTSWSTPASVRAAFRDPALFTTYVPGWREVIILSDPQGIAVKLRTVAIRWSWEHVAGEADRWVALHITGWAEEVHKLVAALEAGNDVLAGTQRSLLAIHLAGVMAMRHRILCGTENVLWTLVSDAMGEAWVSAQSRALGIGGESLESASRAALELYAIAAREAWPLLDRTQRAVVGHACAIAGHPLP